MLTVLAIYIVLGVVAGFIGGLLGLGGGIVIVPALLFIFAWQGFSNDLLMHLAIATSLATIIFTSISASYAHHTRGAVLWSPVLRLLPGLIIGAIGGAMMADHLSAAILRRSFGIFEILVALQIGLAVKPPPHRQLLGASGLLFVGTGIGTLATILGIGGGTLTVPFLLWCRVNIRQAVATASACGLPIALAGTVALVIAGWDNYRLPEYSLGYVHWPAALLISLASILFAPAGVKLAHTLPVLILQRIFAVILCGIGLKMLF